MSRIEDYALIGDLQTAALVGKTHYRPQRKHSLSARDCREGLLHHGYAFVHWKELSHFPLIYDEYFQNRLCWVRERSYAMPGFSGVLTWSRRLIGGLITLPPKATLTMRDH